MNVSADARRGHRDRAVAQVAHRERLFRAGYAVETVVPKDEINTILSWAKGATDSRAPDLEDYSLILRRCRECQCRSPGVGCVIRTRFETHDP